MSIFDYLIEILLFCCLGLYVLFFAFYFIFPLLGHAPYYPSGKKSIKEMIKLAGLKGNERIIDLGSGDGRLVLEAAKYCKVAKGIEHNPFFVFFSNIKKCFFRRKANVSFVYGNMYKHDLSQYDVIFCYLLPESMRKLEQKMKKELKPGTKVISNTFHIKVFKEVKSVGKIKMYVVK